MLDVRRRYTYGIPAVLLLLLALAVLLLLADALLFGTKLFFTLAAHLLGIVDAVDERVR